MTESEWAKGLAQEFKAGRARKAEEDAQIQKEQKSRKEFASKLWTQVKDDFKARAQMFNAAAGEEILIWEAGDGNTFALRRNDNEGCVKGIYQEAGYEINIEVLGRLVPFHVALEYRTGKYRLFGVGDKPSEPDDLAEILIEELLGKFKSPES